jgi:non-specific serine/threonine protein kinase
VPSDAAPPTGRALQRVLLEVIAALAPGTAADRPATAARIHRLLVLRYVDGRDAGEVWAELGIGKSEFYREHQRGVRAVAAALAARAAVRHADLPRPSHTGRSAGARAEPGNIPLPQTSFVGRERALAEVGRLLGEARLLTLTGAGGVGKSRLAVEVARAIRPAYADGIWLVELAGLTDLTAVPHAVARALAIREEPDRPLTETLVAALAPRRLVLVLDNCEHVLDGCAPLVDALVRGCADLRVLATSRERLHLSAEQEYPVLPLAVPVLRGSLSMAHLSAIEAVRLFVDRARSARPDFHLTEVNAVAVASICRRLDGLPLAIELAAARVRLFPPTELLARLERRLPLLTGGPRDVPARQRTLRDTIAWSHALLAPAEQRLFRRLCVFTGGCTTDAADTVCAAGDLDVLAALDSLVGKNLIQQEEQPDGAARFAMMETIREYALDQLATSGEEPELRRRHAAYFLALVEASGAVLVGTAQDRRRLAAEEDNIGAALHWLVRHG